MTTQETWLSETIDLATADDDKTDSRRVETFEEAGILTTNRGLVVTFRDGSEIQTTLIRSRRRRDDNN